MEIKIRTEELTKDELITLIPILIRQNKAKNGIIPPVRRQQKHKSFSKTDILFIIRDHRAGATVSELAKRNNRTRESIKNLLYRIDHPKLHTQAMKEALAE